MERLRGGRHQSGGEADLKTRGKGGSELVRSFRTVGRLSICGWGVEDMKATEAAKCWKDFGEEDIQAGRV